MQILGQKNGEKWKKREKMTRDTISGNERRWDVGMQFRRNGRRKERALVDARSRGTA